MKEDYEEAVRPCIVLDEGAPEAADVAVPVLIDFKGQFRVKLGAGHESVLLIHPDGYVAVHREGFNFRMLSLRHSHRRLTTTGRFGVSC